MALEINFLFVYGRLREYYVDQDNTDIHSHITIPVRTTGRLYEYKGDAVLIEDKKSYVYGNLLAATEIKVLLRHTDSFMEFDENDYENSKYIRGIKEVYIEELGENIKAWCYVFPSSRKWELDKNGKVIESGDWLQYRKMLQEEKEKINVEE